MENKAKRYVVTLRMSKDTRRVFRLLAAALDQDMNEMVTTVVVEKAKALGLDDVAVADTTTQSGDKGDLSVVA